MDFDFIHKQVLSGSKLKNCTKLHFINPNGEQGSEKFAAIRGGIAFASEKSPFYSCIVGQPLPDKFDEVKEPFFVLLKETVHAGFDLIQRYSQLKDDAELFCCDWYCDFSDKYDSERESLYEYNSKFSQSFGDLVPAPYANQFRVGLELIKTQTSQNKLIIPKDTEVYSQLTRFTADDLGGKKIAQRFYALEALRHIASSFKRDPATIQESNYRRRPEGLNPWMAY